MIDSVESWTGGKLRSMMKIAQKARDYETCQIYKDEYAKRKKEMEDKIAEVLADGAGYVSVFLHRTKRTVKEVRIKSSLCARHSDNMVDLIILMDRYGRASLRRYGEWPYELIVRRTDPAVFMVHVVNNETETNLYHL
jgi:hypothetical protein